MQQVERDCYIYEISIINGTSIHVCFFAFLEKKEKTILIKFDVYKKLILTKKHSKIIFAIDF